VACPTQKKELALACRIKESRLPGRMKKAGENGHGKLETLRGRAGFHIAYSGREEKGGR